MMEVLRDNRGILTKFEQRDHFDQLLQLRAKVGVIVAKFKAK